MPHGHDHHGSGNGNGHSHGPAAKVRLVGTVAGVDACHLLTDGDNLVAGSALACDLVIADPLVPRRAFRLREVKDHRERGRACDSGWVFEALPGARVFVNNELASREHLHFGDTIALGCHRFTFLDGRSDERDRRANIDVEDLCTALVKPLPIPTGFLQGQASWRDRVRSRKAIVPGILLALLAALLLFLFHQPEKIFEQMQEPIEVVMAPSEVGPPSPGAVRSMAQVQRQTVATPSDNDKPAGIQDKTVQPIRNLSIDTMAMKNDALTPAPPVEVSRVMDQTTPDLAPLAMAAPAPAKIEMKRDTAALSRSAPVRRLSVAEAATLAARQDVTFADGVAGGTGRVKTNKGTIQASTSTVVSSQAAQQRATPPPAKLDQGKADVLAGLRYQASPVQTESYMGTRIPVARMTESLSAIPGAETAGAGGSGNVSGPSKSYTLDGEVSDGEIALSNLKTGRFVVHGPGTPPWAEPATYCYVGKTVVDGKPFLYVSFVCTDPNVDAIVNSYANNPGSYRIEKDDSVEIFLDTTYNRTSYYQMIINTRGLYWTQYAPDATRGINAEGTAWDASPRIKTTINRAGGRWTVEALIPFDRLGGVPAPGSRWAVNFVRNYRGQTNPGGYQNWFSVYDASVNYHHPRLFGAFQW